MRKLGLPIAVFVALLAAYSVIPAAAYDPGTARLPAPHRPHDGARPFAPSASSAGTRSPAPAAAPSVLCDGTFRTVASPNNTSDNVLFGNAAVSASDVWSVGVWNNPSNHLQTLAEHWNGTSWLKVPTVNPGVRDNVLYSVATVSANDVWAVGYIDVGPVGSFQAATLAEHWNGTTWTRVSTPNLSVGSYLYAVTAVSATNVYAVGQYFNVGSQSFNPLIEQYDGSIWTAKAGPSVNSDTSNSSQLLAVSAFNAADIWAVGSYSASSGSALQTLAEHYDGVSWTVQPSVNLAAWNNEMFGVTVLEANHAVGVGYGRSGPNPAEVREGQAWDLKIGSGLLTGGLSAAANGDSALEAVARSGDGVWAVGYSRVYPVPTAPNPISTLAWPATWDSSTHTLTWGLQGTSANPIPTNNNGFFGAAAISPSVFWAAGYHDKAVDQTLTELYCGLHFTVTAPATAAQSVPFNVIVAAKNADNSTATNYRGTIHFTSSDPPATLPADYSFTNVDAGTKTFPAGVTLQDVFHNPTTITASDALAPFETGSTIVTVACSGVCQAPPGTPGGRDANPGPPSGGPPPRVPARSGALSPHPGSPSAATILVKPPARGRIAAGRVSVDAPAVATHRSGTFRPVVSTARLISHTGPLAI
jgi:hypothetical protein